MMKNLRVKLVALIVMMMLVSGVCTILISVLISSESIIKESKDSQIEIVNTVLDLSENTDYPVDKISELSSNRMYRVSKIEDLSKYKDEAVKLKNGEYSQIRLKGMPIVKTVLKVDDNYLVISTCYNRSNEHFKGFLITGTAITISIIIATVISGVISKRVLSPVRALSRATEEVAKGDFSVRVDIPKDYEFGFLTENFNKMVHELSSIETLRNDFVSNVSHEIKTPLASIQGFAKLLQDNNFSEEEKKEFTDIIISESTRLSKLTSNILKLSKIENQEINTKKVEFSLDEQIRCAILIMEQEWSRKNINLDIELEEVNIVENEDLLQQVWINLIGNAIKFTEDGGYVSIKLEDYKDKIEVEISDSGIGMTEDIQRHMFDKFYQGDRSHLSEGNGLGLSLAKRIIDICGGKIYIKSELGVGTTFTIELRKDKDTI
ncbi:HAMP domain-containing sensor histidine kinase [Metaclostridioides mangenotii]|uniref:histidine kinase n=1 Tax=Metaclostridioides mangenotii TaxID=1540 RepID=A0ABS4EB71_9FIRM|nr:HAMP domain-containing sensor histidine kinase [Clostridioides mangenotii]MBP1855187.1 signal transduction histidine kinase [Clostridioides mangenotii]